MFWFLVFVVGTSSYIPQGATLSTAQPQKRADAVRNRERLLESAHAVFAEQGSKVALEDIARHAGVGIGTLYRHFPNRATLLEGLLHQRLIELKAGALELADQDLNPKEALWRWHQLLLRHLSTYRGLATSLTGTGSDPTSPLNQACQAAQESGAALLRAAQEAGQARDDISATELFLLTAGATWAAEQGLDPTVTATKLLERSFAGVWTHATT